MIRKRSFLICMITFLTVATRQSNAAVAAAGTAAGGTATGASMSGAGLGTGATTAPSTTGSVGTTGVPANVNNGINNTPGSLNAVYGTNGTLNSGINPPGTANPSVGIPTTGTTNPIGALAPMANTGTNTSCSAGALGCTATPTNPVK